MEAFSPEMNFLSLCDFSLCDHQNTVIAKCFWIKDQALIISVILMLTFRLGYSIQTQTGDNHHVRRER